MFSSGKKISRVSCEKICRRKKYRQPLTKILLMRKKIFSMRLDKLICSSQRVILFLLHKYECLKIKKNEKQRKNKKMMSAISSLVRIWKICHSYPRCSFIRNPRVAYFTVKHSYLCNKISYKFVFKNTGSNRIIS